MHLARNYTLDKSAGGRTEVRRSPDGRTLGYVTNDHGAFQAFDSTWIPFRDSYRTEAEAVGAILDVTGVYP